jgi:hypothetical protein
MKIMYLDHGNNRFINDTCHQHDARLPAGRFSCRKDVFAVKTMPQLIFMPQNQHTNRRRGDGVSKNILCFTLTVVLAVGHVACARGADIHGELETFGLNYTPAEYHDHFLAKLAEMDKSKRQDYYQDMLNGGSLFEQYLDVMTSLPLPSPASRGGSTRMGSANVGKFDNASKEYINYLWGLKYDPDNGDVQITYQDVAVVDYSNADIAGIDGYTHRYETPVRTTVTMFASEFNRYRVNIEMYVSGWEGTGYKPKNISISTALNTKDKDRFYLLTDDFEGEKLIISRLDSQGNILEESSDFATSGHYYYEGLPYSFLSIFYSYLQKSGVRRVFWLHHDWPVIPQVQSPDEVMKIDYSFWLEGNLYNKGGNPEAAMFNTSKAFIYVDFESPDGQAIACSSTDDTLGGLFPIPPYPDGQTLTNQHVTLVEPSYTATRRGLTDAAIQFKIKASYANWNMPIPQAWFVGLHALSINGKDYVRYARVTKEGNTYILSLPWSAVANSLVSRNLPLTLHEYSLSLTQNTSTYTRYGKITVFNPYMNIVAEPAVAEPNLQNKQYDLIAHYANKYGMYYAHIATTNLQNRQSGRCYANGADLSSVIKVYGNWPVGYLPKTKYGKQILINYQQLAKFMLLHKNFSTGTSHGNTDAILGANEMTATDYDKFSPDTLAGYASKEFDGIKVYNKGAKWFSAAANYTGTAKTITPPPTITPAPTPIATAPPLQETSVTPNGYPLGTRVEIDGEFWHIVRYEFKNSTEYVQLLRENYLMPSDVGSSGTGYEEYCPVFNFYPFAEGSVPYEPYKEWAKVQMNNIWESKGRPQMDNIDVLSMFDYAPSSSYDYDPLGNVQPGPVLTYYRNGQTFSFPYDYYKSTHAFIPSRAELYYHMSVPESFADVDHIINPDSDYQNVGEIQRLYPYSFWLYSDYIPNFFKPYNISANRQYMASVDLSWFTTRNPYSLTPNQSNEPNGQWLRPSIWVVSDLLFALGAVRE